MITLKFEKEIKGDVAAAGFVAQIRLATVNFSAFRSVSVANGSQTRETGTPSFSQIDCTKEFDIASTELFMQSVSGDSLGKAILSFLQTDEKGNPQVYLTLTLDDPIVTSYSVNGSSDSKPFESFSLNFNKIMMAYTQHTGEKATKASPKGWDLAASKAA